MEFTTQEFITHFPVMSCFQCTHLMQKKCDMYPTFVIEEPERPCRCLHFDEIINSVNTP